MATYRVPVGPLPTAGEEGEKIELNREKGMRANNFMREHNYRFTSEEELRDFVDRNILPSEIAQKLAAQTKQKAPIAAARTPQPPQPEPGKVVPFPSRMHDQRPRFAASTQQAH